VEKGDSRWLGLTDQTRGAAAAAASPVLRKTSIGEGNRECGLSVRNVVPTLTSNKR
jgi:hypothetical protein